MRKIVHPVRVARYVFIASMALFVVYAAFAPATPAAADVDTFINIAGGIAQPGTTNVSVGTRVVWVNRQIEGSVTITSDTGVFDTGMLMPGQSYFYVFNTPGTFAYHATQAPGVRGKIVVTPAPPPVTILVPQPPPARVVQSGVNVPLSTIPLLPQSGINVPQPQEGSLNQLPPNAAPPVYLPLASAPPAPVVQPPTNYATYGYAVPTAAAPVYPPRTGGGGLASSYSNEDQPTP